MTQILYPEENPEVKRYSSIDQFKGFISTYKQGGLAPLVFDQLDGIRCETIKTHPVVLTFYDSLGYIFPEGRCTYTSDKFVYFDKEGVEKKPLPSCFGGGGEFYDTWVEANAFVNFDDDSSIGVHDKQTLRVGLDYVKCDETLPAVD